MVQGAPGLRTIRDKPVKFSADDGEQIWALRNAYKNGDRYNGKYIFQSREGVTEVLRLFYTDLIREANSSFCTEL
jgi:hypothetical protein